MTVRRGGAFEATDDVAREVAKGRSLWQDALGRLRRNRAAMASIVILALPRSPGRSARAPVVATYEALLTSHGAFRSRFG